MRADEVNGYSIIISGNDNIGVPSTREDKIVVGGFDVAKIPLKVTYSISDFVEKGLLFQYAVNRASSLFSIASYATRKHEIRVGLDKDLEVIYFSHLRVM